MRTEQQGALHELTVYATALWARALADDGRYAAAIHALARNLSVMERVLGPAHMQVRPCAQQYVGKSQSCMVTGRRGLRRDLQCR